MSQTTEVEKACYLCAGPTRLLEAGDVHYRICRECGLIMRDTGPCATDIGTLYGSNYYSNDETYPDWDSDPQLMHILQQRVSTLAGLMPGRGLLLDVGAGLGHFMAAAQREGWNVFGVEPSDYARDVAEQRTGAPVVSDLAQIPDDVSWDCVTLWDVLEHDADPLALASRLGATMRPGGLLGVSMPNVGGLEARLRGPSWRFFRPEYGHITHHSLHTLTLLLQRAGFTIVQAETFGSVNVRDRLVTPVPASLSRAVQHGLDRLVASTRLGRTMTIYARRR